MKNSKPIKLLPESEQKLAVDKIIAFFLDERDEEIGVIAAREILDFIETEIAPAIYNKGLQDSAELAREIQAEFNFKLEELKKVD